MKGTHYDLQTKKIFHSTDVLFKEDIFPFKASSVTHYGTPDKVANDPILPSLAPSFVPDSPRFSASSPLIHPLETGSQCLVHNSSVAPSFDTDVCQHSSCSPIPTQHDVVIPYLASPFDHSSLNIVEAHIRRSTRSKAPPA